MANVPIGYFIPTLLLAYATYFVVVPEDWLRFLKPLRYYFAVVNEVPFIALLALILTNWLAISQNDVSSPIGWIAFGLSVFTALGLLVIILWSAQTKQVIIKALDKNLGAQWRNAIDNRIITQLQSRFTPVALLGPLLIRRHDVKRTANVRYGDAGRYNLLDIYRGKSLPGKSPVLIHLHGGAMVTGKKNHDALPLLYTLASKGWVCISANYRLSPGATFPDQLVDIKKVIAWTRAHAHEYNIDPSAIFLAGGSAGGYLAAQAALTCNDIELQPGFKDADTSVAAAITLYGYYDESWLQAKSVGFRKNIPPFFILHGDRDETLPIKNAHQFAKRLRDTSYAPVVFAALPHGRHNFDLFHSIRGEAVLNGIEAFTSWVRSSPK